MKKINRSNIKFLLLCLSIAGIVLAVDLAVPLGVAGGVPYILVVLASLRLPGRKYTLFFAILVSLLTLTGFYLSPQGGELWKVLLNRSLALFAVWVTAGVSLKRKQAESRLQQHHDRLEEIVAQRSAEIEQMHKELEASLAWQLDAEKEKLHVLKTTMRTVQDIVNNFLNNLQLFLIESGQGEALSPGSLESMQSLMQATSKRLNAIADLDEVKEKDIGYGMSVIDIDGAS